MHDKHITSPTSIIESCYNHTATCPGTEEKSGFEDSEYGKSLGMFEHLSGYDAIKAIVSTVNERLNYTNCQLRKAVRAEKESIHTYLGCFETFLGQRLRKWIA
jgi:hypothetical protein